MFLAEGTARGKVMRPPEMWTPLSLAGGDPDQPLPALCCTECHCLYVPQWERNWAACRLKARTTGNLSTIPPASILQSAKGLRAASEVGNSK